MVSKYELTDFEVTIIQRALNLYKQVGAIKNEETMVIDDAKNALENPIPEPEFVKFDGAVDFRQL
jgi:hypothetical protein